MKPFLRYALLAALGVSLGVAALLRTRTSAPRATLRVGAALVPHGEILKFIQPRLKEQGLELTIVSFDDENQLNPALAEGSLDANFFQHIPFLDAVAREKGYAFVAAGAVHVEPMGFYSLRAGSRDQLRDGALIGIPNNPSNEFRALALLEAQGLIRLRPGLPGFSATPRDILENPRGFRFREVDVTQLPRSLQDLDGAVINTNTMIEARLDPGTALFREGPDSPYANVLVVRRGDENRADIRKLLAALQSPEVKAFLGRTYGSSIIPAF